MFPPTLCLLGFVWVVLAQELCENYGTQNGSSCSCPPGFGGSTCSEPGCGGDIFQGLNRSLVSGNSTSSANLSASSCSCESGWGGFGCNVCQSAWACQTAFTNANGSSSSGSNSLTSGPSGQNSTLVCNTEPKVLAAGQMSCNVINPTLQDLFPGNTNLNILRTLQPGLTPLPNVTGFGDAGSVYAQLWYDGVEQFYCAADSCTQNVGSDNATDWQCQNLKCTCRENTTFCGGGITSLTNTIDGLGGALSISCAEPSNGSSTTCGFQQSVLNSLFGSNGLSLSDCTFGECVAQSVIDTASPGSSSSAEDAHKSLSGGVIAGLAVVGALILLALMFLAYGFSRQRRAKKGWPRDVLSHGGITLSWRDVSYVVPGASGNRIFRRKTKNESGYTDEKVILDNVSGRVEPGHMMAILGPSGAGKTTLVEILAGKQKAGYVSGHVSRTSVSGDDAGFPRIAFVPQQDVLPAMLTVREALTFAAELRLPECVPAHEKCARVDAVLAQLGLDRVADARIGSGARRGVSGGEMRRVSIGLELVGRPDALVLDEPTSGLDSVSAARVAEVLRAVAHDPEHPIAVIASIHQPSSKLYHTFDRVMVLSHGRALYSGRGGLAPAEHFAAHGVGMSPEGYNIAEHLLDIASDPQPALFSVEHSTPETTSDPLIATVDSKKSEDANGIGFSGAAELEKGGGGRISHRSGSQYSTTFLTQFEVLSGREWKILRRDKTLCITHVGVASVLGVFVGGLYFNTNLTIAGFQSRVGCLFFLGALIAFSSLSALYNVVETRPLFLRERSNMYYSPTAWLLSRLVFDVVPLRLIPTIIVSSITYWMAGLADDPAHFFKFLFILVLYSLAMTLFNFLLACFFENGGVAILLSALSALYQMTFAGFFVHLNSIPPVLRWLQWLCPLKYSLEALSVNEVGSGLMIQDTLQGVPVDVSASLIMQLLFGFGVNNYYRDVLVLFAFIAGFGVSVIGVVWFKVRERR
ncbi:hypothetical protein DFH11DRAFT_1704353 [Phellopilus nigrolimitatus]|nr:hypothetical protein DFH11DRAFT_1704353 [Phellopilus nigrolimitatus]